MLAPADNDETDGGPRKAPRHGAALRRDARGEAGRRADPLRGRAGRRGRARPQAQAAGPRRLGHGDGAAALTKAVKAQGLRPQFQARGARRAGPWRPGRAAAGARRARCAGDGPQGRPGGDRLRQGRGGARGTAAWSPSCTPPTARRTGRRKLAAAAAPAAKRRKRRRNPGHRGVYVGAIGFGIGAVKCGTCCPARRPSERRVSCALPEPRTLPDRSIRTDEAAGRTATFECKAISRYRRV